MRPHLDSSLLLLFLVRLLVCLFVFVVNIYILCPLACREGDIFCLFLQGSRTWETMNSKTRGGKEAKKVSLL